MAIYKIDHSWSVISCNVGTQEAFAMKIKMINFIKMHTFCKKNYLISYKKLNFAYFYKFKPQIWAFIKTPFLELLKTPDSWQGTTDNAMSHIIKPCVHRLEILFGSRTSENDWDEGVMAHYAWASPRRQTWCGSTLAYSACLLPLRTASP